MPNLSDLLAIIRSRRSIRRYSTKKPASSQIEQILEAGRWAPSGMNNQPWRFLIIEDKTKKEVLSKFTKYGKAIKSAAVEIVVCMDIADSYNREKDLMAMGACIQNMLLEAYSLGLGACWLGEILNKKDEVCSFLGLDKDLELVAVLALGYPDKAMPKSCRKALRSLKIEYRK